MIAKFSLIAFCMALIMIQGVSCVEFGFSMEDANDHFSIHESYDVGTASSVEETILGDPTSSSSGRQGRSLEPEMLVWSRRFALEILR